MSRPARVRLVLLAAVLLIAAGGLAFVFWPFGPDDVPLGPTVPTPDPRLTFDTPFRNARPGIDYVGDAACAVCHQKIDQSYHQHPMGRSAVLGTDKNRSENFNG